MNSSMSHTSVIALAAGLCFTAAGAIAQEAPGEGVTVIPLQTAVDTARFQAVLVTKALDELGYEVEDIRELDIAASHLAVANGDGTFLADHWDPLHADFFTQAGGEELIYREGAYSPNAFQGYLIDRATAEEHGITNIGQLKDPDIADLFDNDGDGKADLTGCTPGWGCERVIEHHLDDFGLRDTITHNQGSYSAIIADTITRYENGEPILYYTWVPYWVSGVLVPGEDVVWLEVPHSSLPGSRAGADTALPDGTNYGFQINNQRIIANRAFTEENPAAAKLFEIMEVSPNDISAQNLLMRDGQDSEADVERHADAWIAGHQEQWNAWLEEARAAAE